MQSKNANNPWLIFLEYALGMVTLLLCLVTPFLVCAVVESMMNGGMQ